ncbi:Uncharacterised protein [Mycobacteroides abscessus subsp. abscessus]|nr:Uncharacterised protein [Mycobacteroides abscessus subsp. abscessus]
MAVPRQEPRLEMLRDSPEISPCRLSLNADWTMSTEGVSMVPSPTPISRRPGANPHGLTERPARARRTAMPAMVVAKPMMIRARRVRRRASHAADSEVARSPAVAAVKMTPVWMAL